MNKKWGIVGLLIGLLLLVTACGQTEEEQGSTGVVDELTVIEVDLDVPELAEVGEVVTFSSAVTQGDDLVEDANEVIYEIWKEGQKEESVMIEADVQNGHIYLLDYIFDEEGLYHVQTHVTARGLHRMPTAQISIGDYNEGNDEVAEETGHEHSHENHDHHHDHHHDVEIETNLKDDKVVIHLIIDGEDYINGNVTFEMSKEGDEQTRWLDLTEVGDGVYELPHIEQYSGTYVVTVHIQDDELHEHIDITLDF
ncbi:FixH family protein [Alkalihalobacillus sp. MEB130]|uniref:FixH family protein n=1 Tax=Alkalihalobacillus sp. MEB130 TaxID=2976704 RepID=UPI0028DF8E3A|nr:FixH family protein [Alkalihalobacillus sp. MEB130]MDT8861422.1 FixH family protein [Alkalihalobacillus sp. MEB130]